MPSTRDVVSALERFFAAKKSAKESLDAVNREIDRVAPGLYEEILSERQQELAKWERRIEEVLHRFALFPDRHAQHFERLDRDFYPKCPEGNQATFDSSVFIMTKFPVPGDEQADRLQAVIDLTRQAIVARGYQALLAADQQFHAWIWSNVEIFLLGCARGVAIVEDRYLPELNPNVAMEWGWMRGMGRDVLFLREAGFVSDRADWSGLISYPFTWNDPRPGIEAGLAKFLPLR